jgi:hypothetical protein
MSKVTIQGDASGTGIFTIASPNSNTDRTLVLPDEAGTILTTSSDVLTSASSIPAANLTGTVVQTNVPLFSVSRSGTQNPSASTWTKAALNVANIDTASCFDSTTNYRFTPNVPGYYQFNFSGNSTGSPSETYLQVRKNNGGGITSYWLAGAVNQWSGGGSYIDIANGSTDYFELWLYRAGGTPAFSSLLFSGVLVRAA